MNINRGLHCPTTAHEPAGRRMPRKRQLNALRRISKPNFSTTGRGGRRREIYTKYVVAFAAANHTAQHAKVSYPPWEEVSSRTPSDMHTDMVFVGNFLDERGESSKRRAMRYSEMISFCGRHSRCVRPPWFGESRHGSFSTGCMMVLQIILA